MLEGERVEPRRYDHRSNLVRDALRLAGDLPRISRAPGLVKDESLPVPAIPHNCTGGRSRPISTASLQRLPAVHGPPIYPVVYRGSLSPRGTVDTSSWGRFRA